MKDSEEGSQTTNIDSLTPQTHHRPMSCSPEILQFILQCEAEEDVVKRDAQHNQLRKIVDEFSPSPVTGKLRQTLPSHEDNIFIVRISPKKKGPLEDYSIMKDETNPHAYKWDRDAYGRIQKGNWLGFILGDVDDAIVELFKVDEIGGIRPGHWETTKYTDQKVDRLVSTRDVILFEKKGPVYMDWNHWKKKVNYRDKYMPRGTTSAKNPFN